MLHLSFIEIHIVFKIKSSVLKRTQEDGVHISRNIREAYEIDKINGTLYVVHGTANIRFICFKLLE